ncbi:MAG: LON peptidase substrate-binding domain-containing protein [Thermoguttaceae bacterium]
MAFDPENLFFSVSDFDHKTRLVMVDGVVMFPRLMAACCVSKRSHIDLVEAALQTNHLISVGVASLPIDVACLCRIVATQRDSNGHIHLLLMGLHRVRVGVPIALNEQRSVRSAEICDEDEEVTHETDHEELNHLRLLIGNIARDLFLAGGVQAEMIEQLKSLFSNQQVPLGNICDLLASMFEIDADEKGAILAEVEVTRRAQYLVASMAKLAIKHQISNQNQSEQKHATSYGSYPASFSYN